MGATVSEHLGLTPHKLQNIDIFQLPTTEIVSFLLAIMLFHYINYFINNSVRKTLSAFKIEIVMA